MTDKQTKQGDLSSAYRKDGRTMAAKRIKEVTTAYREQLGTSPTASQSVLISSAATFTVLIERDDAALTRGEDIDQASYRQNVAALRAILTQLGITRPTRDLTKAEAQGTDEHAAALMDA